MSTLPTPARRRLSENGIDEMGLTLGRAKSMLGAHLTHHRVVYIDPLCTDIYDLAGLKAAVRTGDRVEDPGEFPLRIVVTPVTRLGGDCDH